MSKDIVLLAGSPRKGGNSDKLAGAFIMGAESAGKTVTMFRTAAMSIGGCLACNQCSIHINGLCVLKDDMHLILKALKKADTLVFTSPVYHAGVTAQLKLVIDRICTLKNIKRAALLMTCDEPNVTAADAAVLMFEKIIAFRKWDNAGVIVAPGLFQKDDINGRDELRLAENLGRVI